MYYADLHIHSRYSRATSRDCDLPHLDFWAGRKGIALVGTGDFTHPAWRQELREQLVPAEEGLYRLRQDLRLPGAGEAARFLVTGEISCIYKQGGKTRKIHNVILLPSLEAAETLSRRLEQVGNLHLNLDLAKLFGKLTHHFTSEKVGRQKPERARVARSRNQSCIKNATRSTT